jgi:hypothetical protein
LKIDNVGRSRLAALNLPGGSLAAFDPSVDNTVETIAAAADGSAVYIGGIFTSVRGIPSKGLAKLDANGNPISVAWQSYIGPPKDIEVSPDGTRLAVALAGEGLSEGQTGTSEAAWSPTRTSPFLANATTEGVVRAPSAFAMTVGSPPSRTAMTEFVVPRSIPTARAT